MNQVLGRKGAVFTHRYHATALTTPTQTRNALAYVLNNWRRHNEDKRGHAQAATALDRTRPGWFSTAGASPSTSPSGDQPTNSYPRRRRRPGFCAKAGVGPGHASASGPSPARTRADATLERLAAGVAQERPLVVPVWCLGRTRPVRRRWRRRWISSWPARVRSRCGEPAGARASSGPGLARVGSAAERCGTRASGANAVALDNGAQRALVSPRRPAPARPAPLPTAPSCAGGP